MISINKVKTLIAILFLTVIATEIYAEAAQQAWNEKRVLWFKKPAKEWKVGLPVGNGRFGAMVLGTYPKERIQLNEDSIWAKEPMMRHPATTKDRIAEVQKLVDAGKYKEAHDLYESKIIMADAPPIGSYQTMGDLWIQHVGLATMESKFYFRKLDVATGLVTVTQPLSDGSVITEEVLSSAVDNCIAIRLSSTAADGHPSPRDAPTAVWTGGSALFWGGLAGGPLRSGGCYALEQEADVDSDGVTACDGDCNDADAGVFALPSEIEHLVFTGKTTLVWDSDTANSGPGTVYDVLVGDLGDLPAGNPLSGGCPEDDLAATTAELTEEPRPGAGAYVLVRGDNSCGPGTYGSGSDGAPRSSPTCP